MRAYMAFDRHMEPEAGAVLVFAHTAREAHRLAWPTLYGWCTDRYVDVGVRWLREGCEHLRRSDEPHVVHPPICSICELWHTKPLDENDRCEGCAEYYAEEEVASG